MSILCRYVVVSVSSSLSQSRRDCDKLAAKRSRCCSKMPTVASKVQRSPAKTIPPLEQNHLLPPTKLLLCSKTKTALLHHQPTVFQLVIHKPLPLEALRPRTPPSGVKYRKNLNTGRETHLCSCRPLRLRAPPKGKLLFELTQ